MRQPLLYGVLLVSLLGCNSKPGPTGPVKVGVILPQLGAAGTAGLPMTRAAELARDAINEAGGIGGRPIELFVYDTSKSVQEGNMSAGTTGTEALQAALAEGVVGIIGPFSSGVLTEIEAAVSESGITVVSPSSTLVELAKDDTVFRVVPKDSVQVRMMVRYLTTLPTPINEVLLTHSNQAWGTGLAAEFRARFEAHGGKLIGEPVSSNIGASQASLEPAWNEILARKPKVIVSMTGARDSLAWMTKWTGSGALKDVQWIFADSTKTSSFTRNAPPQAKGVKGAATVNPSEGEAYKYFQSVHEMAGADFKTIYVSNTWDAMFLLAAGLRQQQVRYSVDLGGPDLQRAIRDVSSGGQVMHAGQWRDISVLIGRKGDVDYDGASGPIDVDEMGDVIAPYEMWEVQDNGGVLSFGSIQYAEAREVADY